MVVSSFDIEGGGGGRGIVIVRIVISIGILIGSSSTGGAPSSIARPTIAATAIATTTIGVVVLVRSIHSSTISSRIVGVVHHCHRHCHDRSV